MTARRSPGTTAPSQAHNNIEAILRLEKEGEQDLALHHRIFHAVGWFFGTTYFVAAQCVAVGLWVALNGMAGSHQAIDPYHSTSGDVSFAGGRAFDLLRPDPAERDRPHFRAAGSS